MFDELFGRVWAVWSIVGLWRLRERGTHPNVPSTPRRWPLSAWTRTQMAVLPSSRSCGGQSRVRGNVLGIGWVGFRDAEESL